MEGRRRPQSFNRGPFGGFPSGGGGHGLRDPGARPTSASKRPTPSAEPSRAGYGWGKEQRPYSSESQGRPQGLTRQASAPSLVPNSSANMSYDSISRPGVGYDAFSRSSPALRRSNSTTAVGSRGGAGGGGGGVAGLRSGSGFSSVPRRRPYENPSAYATPERDWEFGSRAAGPGTGGGGGGFHHRSDALQLESRLTERLREHSLSATEGATRRPVGGLRSNSMGAPPHEASRWQEDSYQPPQRGYQPPPSRFDPRSPNLDMGRGTPGGLGWGRPSASNMSTPQMEAHHYGSRSAQRRQEFTPGSGKPTPPQLRSDMSMTGLTDSSGMPESRLKIYSDLFEEVIERDRVFGSLLRKIKTAYDMLLVRSPAVPPFPMDASSLNHHGHGHEALEQNSWAGGQDNRGPGSLHSTSNEPTTRAEGGQGWEMQRENRVLKDLVERLHLELEEAVRREHRWKQKVTKLKAREDRSDRGQTPPKAGKAVDDIWGQGPPGLPSKEFFSQAHLDLYAQVAHQFPDGQGLADAPDRISPGGTRIAPPRFHANCREPTLEVQEGPLNQGGLLSLSSISPTASVPPLPESFNAESARSEDSGSLPQRPTRRHCAKPDNIPRLDFTKLKVVDDEDEEEDDMDGEGYEDEDLDEMQAHGKLGEQSDSPTDYDDREDEAACWPSFDRCSIKDPGHICQPGKARAEMPRPGNPMGYDGVDDDDEDFA